MGRHSAAPEPHSEPQPDDASDAGDTGDTGGRRRPRLLDRLALAAAAAGGTGAVMVWADAAPGACVLGGVGAGVVVLVAAQVAGSLPGPQHTGRDGRVDGEP